jgi:hypothetical protein
MFGDKLAGAHAKINALVALIVAAGFPKINAETAADPKTEAKDLPSAEDFKAHLNGQTKAAVDAATGPLNTKIGELNKAAEGFAATAAELAAFKTGLADAGVKLGDFVTAATCEGKDDAEKAKNAAAKNAAMVKEAIGVAVAQKSTKQIAAAGHEHALDIKPGEEAGNKGAADEAAPTDKADFHAKLGAIKDAGKRNTYFRKHKAKFGL